MGVLGDTVAEGLEEYLLRVNNVVLRRYAANLASRSKEKRMLAAVLIYHSPHFWILEKCSDITERCCFQILWSAGAECVWSREVHLDTMDSDPDRAIAIFTDMADQVICTLEKECAFGKSYERTFRALNFSKALPKRFVAGYPSARRRSECRIHPRVGEGETGRGEGGENGGGRGRVEREMFTVVVFTLA